MDKTKNLFVKLLDQEDRDNVEFVVFANDANISEVTRYLFSQEAYRLRLEKPDLWQAFQVVKEQRTNKGEG